MTARGFTKAEAQKGGWARARAWAEWRRENPSPAEAATVISKLYRNPDDFGGVRLTKKQATWLRDAIWQDYRIDVSNCRHQVCFPDVDGKNIRFAIYPNGAGFLALPVKSQGV